MVLSLRYKVFSIWRVILKKKTKTKLTWLADVPDILRTDVVLVDYSHLLTKRKLEDDDSIEDYVNKDSKKEYMAYGDPNLKLLQKGDIIQLERRGFYICDQPLVKPKSLQLFFIPDGKKLTSTMTDLEWKQLYGH